MSAESPTDAALLQTIAELRSDVNRLVDEQLARVRALEEKRASEAGSERRYSTPQPAQPATPRPPRAAVAARSRESVEERAAPTSDDPSQRLDALARHLDGRLRRSNGKAKAAQVDTSERGSSNANGAGREARQ